MQETHSLTSLLMIWTREMQAIVIKQFQPKKLGIHNVYEGLEEDS